MTANSISYLEELEIEALYYARRADDLPVSPAVAVEADEIAKAIVDEAIADGLLVGGVAVGPDESIEDALMRKAWIKAQEEAIASLNVDNSALQQQVATQTSARLDADAKHRRLQIRSIWFACVALVVGVAAGYLAAKGMR